MSNQNNRLTINDLGSELLRFYNDPPADYQERQPTSVIMNIGVQLMNSFNRGR